MPTIIEPIGAGLLVAVINKFIINNPSLWQHVCGCGHHPPQPHPPEDIHEDASSSTTSINDVEVHMHHAY